MEATHAVITPELTDITTLGLIDIPAPILARQLIRIDSQLFQKVRRQEVLVHLWCPKHKHAKTFSYNLNKYISWFNKVGLLVSSAICECVDIKDRIALIEHFINVTKVLRKHNCYNTLYGITSGLNHGAVNRLKHTWRMVSNRAQANLRDFEVLLSPAQNFRVYRQELGESRVPVIPVMGIVLKDHTFLNEMPKQTSDGLVNLFKLRAIKSHLDTMEVYQRGAIQYAFDDDLPFQKQLMETTVCTPDELYEKSQILEPRELRSEARSSGTS
ncbi:hypothetical protein SARC_09363 [Sphaeroforma arctica JP610]|uniref:Ras-GEF domain-containing protein n=1 Tax=Sphaeroforma arctica JP610 TaxID=667725 RepID=A0A0L0FQB6_9EUKA|nr:hypothetical protein SARC_09363 [Sphaeroforma arctica JP610]KNC78193.1 hypothetical protein SARC_09363 [Sphaeroforma arctica JP610]|eukprot:XP_014152095.1 hypothetical protein SARC_09363 [Sphaeroforma arctica JP610]